MDKNDTRGKIFKKPFLPLLLVFCAALLLLAAGRICFERQKDRRLLRDGTYDTVFLSMFPIDTYREEDFSTYGGRRILKYPSVLPDYESLRKCMWSVLSSENEIGMFYLGIDPTKVTSKQILEFTEAFPDAVFVIFPAYRPLTDWNAMADYESAFFAYRDFVRELADDFSRVRLFPYFAQEWLIADPRNYIGDTLLNEQIAKRLYLYTLDNEYETSYRIREREVEPLFEEFQELLETSRQGGLSVPDLSDWDILFFGDSVLGNYSGHYSIPGYLADLTGANTYNCGWGGSSATKRNGFSVSDMLDYYFSGDVSSIPEDLQARRELSRLLQDLQSQKAGHSNRLYVLYYGINDYFSADPVASSDPFDEATYSGALRSAIKRLQSADPGAKILLSAPNYLTYLEGGTQRADVNGGVYEEYIEAALKVADEFQIPCLDVYHNVITPADHNRFLDGGVHPNEFGEYRIAKALIETIERYFLR